MAWRRPSPNGRGHLQATSEQLLIANQDLERANSELRQLDRMKSEFVSLVSHQLRAPLTNINGALELVAQDATALPPLQPAHAPDPGRGEPPTVAPHPDHPRCLPTRGRPAASSTSDPWRWSRSWPGPRRRRWTPEPRRRWRLHATLGLPPAWADELLLEEVVRNLLENAMRYWPSDEPIELAAGGSVRCPGGQCHGPWPWRAGRGAGAHLRVVPSRRRGRDRRPWIRPGSLFRGPAHPRAARHRSASRVPMGPGGRPRRRGSGSGCPSLAAARTRTTRRPGSDAAEPAPAEPA